MQYRIILFVFYCRTKSPWKEDDEEEGPRKLGNELWRGKRWVQIQKLARCWCIHVHELKAEKLGEPECKKLLIFFVSHNLSSPAVTVSVSHNMIWYPLVVCVFLCHTPYTCSLQFASCHCMCVTQHGLKFMFLCHVTWFEIHPNSCKLHTKKIYT